MTYDSQAPVTYVPDGVPLRAEVAAWVLAFLLVTVFGYLAGRLLADGGGEGRQGKFRLEIASVPQGASIYLNGTLRGRTPIVLDAVPAGRSVFRLEKAGCAPLVAARQVARGGPVAFDLAPSAAGAIRVASKTPRVEVLLDGETAGFTPLAMKDVPSGSHQVVLRKANFDPLVVPVSLRAGETKEIEGVELRDRILTMLEGLARAEPHRIGHLLDLGHYHFLSDRLDESVECYVKAQRLAAQPLSFPQDMDLSADDKAVEQRLRELDVRKLGAEINKHKNAGLWGRNALRFKEKIEAVLPHQPGRR